MLYIGMRGYVCALIYCPYVSFYRVPSYIQPATAS